MPKVTLPFGNTLSDATSYSVATVSAGGLVDNAKWTELINKVNNERARRGRGGSGVSTPSGAIDDAELNAIESAVEVSSATLGTFNDRFGILTHTSYKNGSNVTVNFTQAPAYTGGFSGVSAGNAITAANINGMITKLNAAAAVCVCNCNYCTCNCNYCTCNCNYSCTCNCHYSDARLKTGITLIDTIEGVNVYSFSYLWDKTTKYIGVMAQELVGTKHESALTIDDRGFYKVDYTNLPVNMVKC